MAKFDFTAFFKRHGFIQSNGLNTLIRKQQGIDGAGYVPVEIETSEGITKRRRLVDTGRLNQKAFIFKSDAESMTVMANPESYESGISYADIVAYNDRDSASLSGPHGLTIKLRGPKLFPRNQQEIVTAIKKVDPQYDKDFQAEVDRQFKKMAKLQIKKTLTI